MDCDDDIMRLRRKEEEMNKMRADAASPSTISTASSGSPLVRGSSSSSHQFSSKRPPPTSIAAAQLQCQQQLEFINNSSRAAFSGPKQSSKTEGSSSASKRAKSHSQQHKAEKSAIDGAGDGQSNNKSLGYNLAKSIAYRAYRFNEFWSLNKMRYLNFACLLMTLVCLITIIVFSSNNNNNNSGNTNNQAASSAIAANNNDMMRFAKVRPIEPAGDEDSPSSQPLVRSHQVSGEQDVGSDSSSDDMLEEQAAAQPVIKFRRKSEPTDSGERELEQEQQVDGFTMDSLSSEQEQQQQPNNLMMLNELQDPIGSLLKSIRKAANATSSKPIVRRTKNGVTVIISSSFNESSPSPSGLNGSAASLPSLLEKLLPPFLRPPMRSQLGDGLASATITIGAEPMFSSGSLLSPSNGRFLDSPPSFSAFARPQHQRFFMEPLRSPSGSPMFGPTMFPLAMGPMPLPPPSLLSMIMRPQLQDQDFDQDYQPLQVASKASNATSTKNETLNAQASQPQVSTAPLATNSTANSSQPAASSKPETSKTDPDVELFDVLQARPPPPAARFFQNLYGSRSPRVPHFGSMLVFSASNLGPERADSPMQPFGGSSFVAMPPPAGPHMVLLGGPEGSHQSESPSGALLNPVLRSILSNVMSELSGAELKPIGQSNRSILPQARRSLSAPNWATWSQGEPDDEWTVGGSQPASTDSAPSLDRWDGEQLVSPKLLRSRHRDEEMLDSAAMDASEFLTGFQQMGTGQDSPLFSTSAQPNGQQAAMVSGTIRQTIRGPGVSVERVIELPGPRQQSQVVPAGMKSQSLSRMSESDSSESMEPSVHDILVSPVKFQHASQREDREFAPPGFGFIGKLLSDISASAARHQQQQQQRNHNEQQRSSNSINMMKHARAMHSSNSFLDDLDEGDSSDSMAGAAPVAGKSGPAKIRVASARIRTRPLMVAGSEVRSDSVSPSALFVAPSHFTLPSNEAQSRQDNHAKSEMQSSKASSFEESLKSMEERISQALSMAHQSSAGSKLQRSANDQDEQNFATIEVDNKSPEPMNLVNRPAGEHNPFTSPMSPLFGFPSSSVVATGKQLDDTDSAIKPATGSQRQPRSFTYHSNHEVAGSMQKSNDQPSVINDNHKAARSSDEFMPFLAPPTGVVMGRRLDDSPVGEQANQDSVDSISEAKEAETKSLADDRQQNYKTVVV